MHVGARLCNVGPCFSVRLPPTSIRRHVPHRARADGHVHRLAVDSPLHLKQFAGFSGRSVFGIEHQVAAGLSCASAD